MGGIGHLEQLLSIPSARIIYMVKESVKTVEIHYVGLRKDIYELFKGQSIK